MLPLIVFFAVGLALARAPQQYGYAAAALGVAALAAVGRPAEEAAMLLNGLAMGRWAA